MGKEGGILNAIVGSLMLIAGAVFLSTIISLPVALYINFVLNKKSRTSQILRFAFDILFGIPSIVYGAFGFMVMIFFGYQSIDSGNSEKVVLENMKFFISHTFPSRSCP